MLLLNSAPATHPIFGSDEPVGFSDPVLPPADAALVALSLFTTWAIRTGRMLRAVPVAEFTSEELVEFWADDQLDGPPGGRPRARARLNDRRHS